MKDPKENKKARYVMCFRISMETRKKLERKCKKAKKTMSRWIKDKIEEEEPTRKRSLKWIQQKLEEDLTDSSL
jgi:hypothetical protein